MLILFERTRVIVFAGIFALMAAGCSTSSQQVDPTPPMPVATDAVAIIDGHAISLDEFTSNFERNGQVPGEGAATLEDYEDFLNRFVEFRLKVKEARRIGLDKDPTLQAEVLQYRLQLARPYIMERRVFEPLVREMYDRRKEMIEASHILITLEPNASPADTLAAWNTLSTVRDSILAGASFGMMAAQYSQDPSAKGQPGAPGYQGQLGYFGGGRMVEAFEDKAYSTPVGTVSEIFRTNFGYHIMQVTDRQPMPADRDLSHIMVRIQGNTPADQAATESKLDSIRTRLESGVPFADVARDLSDDQNSATRGGNIGKLGYDAGLPFAFRDAAFGIESPGDWTGPVRSQFGFHFIQFNGATELGTFEEEYEAMKTRISQMPRAQAAEDAFAERVIAEVGAWVDSSMVDRWMESMSQDSLVRWLSLTDFSNWEGNPTFVEFADTSLTMTAYQELFRRTVIPATRNVSDRIYGVVDKWLAERAVDYEVDQLENRDQEFATTMQDFRDGLLLFRFMEQEVWEKAASDSTVLEAHYAEQGSTYRYPDRTRVISYSGPLEDKMQSFVSNVRNVGLNEALIQADSDTTFTIRADTTFISEPTGSMFDAVLDLEAGQITDALAFNQGWIALFNDGLDPARQMTFLEARAEIVSEVQADLEERLIADLKQRFNVSVYPEALQALVQ